MNGLESRKIQQYLNELVKDSDKKRLTLKDMNSFKNELESCLSSMDGEIIEYERMPIFPSFMNITSRWKVSERSPLVYQYVNKKEDGTVLFNCSTRPNWNSGGLKCFHPTTSEIAFLKNGGLYLSISTPEKIYHEDIYLPKKLIQTTQSLLTSKLNSNHQN